MHRTPGILFLVDPGRVFHENFPSFIDSFTGDSIIKLILAFQKPKIDLL